MVYHDSSDELSVDIYAFRCQIWESASRFSRFMLLTLESCSSDTGVREATEFYIPRAEYAR